jgi:hypothetical protein
VSQLLEEASQEIACIVHQHVDTSKSLDASRNRFDTVLWMRDIEADRQQAIMHADGCSDFRRVATTA